VVCFAALVARLLVEVLGGVTEEAATALAARVLVEDCFVPVFFSGALPDVDFAGAVVPFAAGFLALFFAAVCFGVGAVFATAFLSATFLPAAFLAVGFLAAGSVTGAAAPFLALFLAGVFFEAAEVGLRATLDVTVFAAAAAILLAVDPAMNARPPLSLVVWPPPHACGEDMPWVPLHQLRDMPVQHREGNCAPQAPFETDVWKRGLSGRLAAPQGVYGPSSSGTATSDPGMV